MDSKIVNELINEGYSFIPVGPDKRPWVESWTKYQYVRPTLDEFAAMQFLDAPALAIVAGEVSGGVECIDIDTKNDTTNHLWEDFKAAIIAADCDEILKKCTIEHTPSGGYHIVYKCDTVGRNDILAYPEGSNKPIIETRGNGGLFTIFPSLNYTLLHNSFIGMVRLTVEERNRLLDVCRSLNKKKVEAIHVKVGGGKPTKTIVDTIEKVLSQIEEQKLDITSDYTSWVKAGHGIAFQFGEDGRDYYQRISQFHPDFDPDATDKKYSHLLLQRNRRRNATIKSFLAICVDYGIDVSDPHSDTTKEEVWARKLGLRWNQITNKIEDPYGEVVDDMGLNELWLRMRTAFKKNIPRGIFEAILFNYNQLEVYNPLVEYMDTLLHRDYEGTPLRIFLTHLDLEDDRWKPLIHKWLLSVVAAAYGTPSELILVMTGPQHNGKTEFFLRLFPSGLQPYFAADKLDQGKDSNILMTEKLIIFDDEFSGQSKKDAKHLKAIASAKKFSIRLPFGRTVKDLPRLAVLCGAANNEDVLNDPTGNRRVLTVVMRSRRYEISDMVNRDDLWAELVQEYFRLENSGGWTLTNEEVGFIKADSEQFQSVNSERETLQKHFSHGTENDKFMTATDVLNALKMKYPTSKVYASKIGQELTYLGFPKVSKRVMGMPMKGYLVRQTGFSENGQEKEGIEDLDFEGDTPF